MKSVHIVLILSSVSFASAFWPGWFSSGDEGGAEAAQPATNSSSNNSGWPAALSKIADFFGSAIPYDADESWYESEAEDEEPTIVKKEAESAEAGEGERLSKDESGAAAIQEPILESLVVEHGDPKLATAEAVLTSEPVSELGETEGAESIPVAKVVESEEEDYEVPVAEPVFQIEMAFEAVADIEPDSKSFELSHEAQSSLDKKPEGKDFNDGGDGAAFVFSSNNCNEEQMLPTQESFAADQIIPESPPLSEDFDFADIYPQNADVIPEYPAEDNVNNATSADFDYAHIFKDDEDDETVLDTIDDAKKEVELQSLLKQKPITPAQVKLKHVEPTPKKPFETNQNVPFLKIPLKKVEPSPAKETVKVEHEFMKARDKIMEKASLARKEEAEKAAQKGANAPNAKLSLYPTSTYFDGDFDKLKPAVKIQVPTELSMKQNPLNRYNRLQSNPLKSVKRTAKV